MIESVTEGPPGDREPSIRERWVDCDGTWVHTADWEPARARPGADPVLLVHGLGGCTVNWELVGQGLADALGARVSALDLPGFGRTRSELHSPTFPQYLDLLTKFQAARGPAIVMGNSMGGSLTVALAASRPDLVTRAVLVNPALPRPKGNLEQLTRTAKFAALMVPRAATPIVRARARRLGHEGLVDATLAMAMSHPELLDPAVRSKMVSLAGGSLFRYLIGPMVRDLATIQCPTLILHGRRDRLVPVAWARALAAKRKDWTYVELDGCGHVPQMEQPERFVGTVMSWIQRGSLTPVD